MPPFSWVIYSLTQPQVANQHVTLMEQIMCTSRQINFQIFKIHNTRVGLNTTENKLFLLNNLIGLDKLNMNFAHYKKLAKIQFLKYGNT